MLLARRGYRILLLDEARLPSDMPMSTHLIWQSGAAHLHRWGLLDRIVGSNCPPIRRCEVDLGPIRLVGEPPSQDGILDAYSPRRIILDKILADAAVAAGAELREATTVTGLLRESESVTGIRATEMIQLFAALASNLAETNRFLERSRTVARPGDLIFSRRRAAAPRNRAMIRTRAAHAPAFACAIDGGNGK